MTNLQEASIFSSLIVYNNGYDNIDTTLLDSLSLGDMFNTFMSFETQLKNNVSKVSIDDSYNYRPEKLALEIYGNQTLYPVILIANDLCSLMQFKSADLNYEAKLPTPEIISTILNNLKG